MDLARALPEGDVVGQYRNYLDAQKAVDYLADQQFPVQSVSIVGNDLHTVERVTARLSYPRVALSGATQGLMLGFFVGLVFAIFGPQPNYFLLLPTMAIGAAVFMVISVIQYSLTRGKRDFASVNAIVARSYDVIVEREVAGQARQLLSQLPMNPGAAAGQPFGGSGHNSARQDSSVQPPAQWPASWQQGQTGQQGQQGGAPEGASGQPQSGQDTQAQGTQAQGPNAPVTTPGNAPDNHTSGNANGTDQAAAAEQSQRPKPPSQRFPDLPDGRPMFGVRVDPKDQSSDGENAEK